MTNTVNHNLKKFSFAIGLLKTIRRGKNVIYKGRLEAIRKQFKLTKKRFYHYLELLHKNNIISDTDTHIVFEKTTNDIINHFFYDENNFKRNTDRLKRFEHINFFKLEDKKNFTLEDIVDHISLQLVEKYTRQQLYKIEQDKILAKRIATGTFRRRVDEKDAFLKRIDFVSENTELNIKNSCSEFLNKSYYAFTSARHSATLLSTSKDYANVILNRLAKAGKITREFVLDKDAKNGILGSRISEIRKFDLSDLSISEKKQFEQIELSNYSEDEILERLNAACWKGWKVIKTKNNKYYKTNNTEMNSGKKIIFFEINPLTGSNINKGKKLGKRKPKVELIKVDNSFTEFKNGSLYDVIETDIDQNDIVNEKESTGSTVIEKMNETIIEEKEVSVVKYDVDFDSEFNEVVLNKKTPVIKSSTEKDFVNKVVNEINNSIASAAFCSAAEANKKEEVMTLIDFVLNNDKLVDDIDSLNKFIRIKNIYK